MHTGSCLCGAITFEVDGELKPPDACHCDQCRRWTACRKTPIEATSDVVEPSGEGIRIVEYAPEHEAAAVELMAELQEFERALSPDRTRGADMARDHFAYLRSLCAERSGQVFLALADSEVIGFAVVFIEAEDEEDGHLLPWCKRYGWLSDLFVKPGFRGQAIASRLVDAAERHCVAIGVRRLGLSVLANNTAARQFYLKAGFKEHEVTYVKDVLDGLTDSGMSEDEVG